ncbi:MAG: YicC family protein [Acidobacteria bacterium]|nr:YicC family protein [Acidobacteriota bacterium]
MTGFSRVRKANELGEVTATVKSVNHRALDLHTHIPSELEAYEPAIRAAVKKASTRGHVDVRISFTPAHAISAAALNRPLFEAYLSALKQAEAEFGVAGQPDLNTALRIPGMLAQPLGDEDAPAELELLVVEAVTAAMASLNTFREREGAEIRELLKAHNANVRRDAAEIEKLREPAVEHFRARLQERLAELLKGVALEPQRLAQEAAILADRSDITEELGRLLVHSRELDVLLDKGGELGKKLDFLMQEMNRETNTILSKTSGVGELGLRITALGLECKANIERIREQALNLE